MCDCCEQMEELRAEVEELREELREESDEKDEQIAELREENQELRETVNELEKRAGFVESTAFELENAVTGERGSWTAEQEAETDGSVMDRLEELETAEPLSGDETPTPNGGNTAPQDTETPLEDIIQLPEELVADSLTANQERARFVAKDITDYSKSVPAGRAIKSSELRRVLVAKAEKTVHPQTVSRVIDKLTEFGKSEVESKKTQNGEKVVVFSEPIVERIEAIQRAAGNHSVVNGARV
jgi:chromosome segregation ATPase